MTDTPVAPDAALDTATRTILEIVSHVPRSHEPASSRPAERAAALAASARRRTAALSAVAALPPGPLGWLTLLPEAAAVWRIQSRMVADIAAAFGQSDRLTPELMLHCLFRHSATRAVGGLAVRAGERVLVRNASYRALQPIARAVAGRVARRTLARGVARWVPGLGSAAIGVYAWRDTEQVARTALDAFSHEIVDATSAESRTLDDGVGAPALDAEFDAAPDAAADGDTVAPADAPDLAPPRTRRGGRRATPRA